MMLNVNATQMNTADKKQRVAWWYYMRKPSMMLNVNASQIRLLFIHRHIIHKCFKSYLYATDHQFNKYASVSSSFSRHICLLRRLRKVWCLAFDLVCLIFNLTHRKASAPYHLMSVLYHLDLFGVFLLLSTSKQHFSPRFWPTIQVLGSLIVEGGYS